MADPFLAEIRIVGFYFAPTGWAHCNGQLLPLSQNTALFSLLGTTYGGNGQSNFALPDLQGRAPLQSGQGPGLSERFLGDYGGSQHVTLLESEIPAHNHALRAGLSVGDNDPGASSRLGGGSPVMATYSSNVSGSALPLAPETLVPAGASAPHENMQPYLTLNFVIALQGIYPQRP